MVVFGGRNNSGVLNDTWEWDGTNWWPRSPATRPPARWTHALAYDSKRGMTVLFGGMNASMAVFADTWEWDGTNWTKRSPAASPSARRSHALAYDSKRGVTVFFGGQDYNRIPYSDTWEWDGTNWTQRKPINVPVARSLHALAYDLKRGVTVLFSGDTWEWESAFALAAQTAGRGAGDLSLSISSFPQTATHVQLLVSGTPAVGGPGTGGLFGLFYPDPLLFQFLILPPAALFFPHFPVASNPYANGPVTFPKGTFTVLKGQVWDLTAIAHGGGEIKGQTNFVRLNW